jgi:hypothetical protein
LSDRDALSLLDPGNRARPFASIELATFYRFNAHKAAFMDIFDDYLGALARLETVASESK